jgi:V/A-type H+-transporting ATPase subunit D
MAQQVFPTKSNLMATKRSLALATQGYDLMDRKRNILVREMMQLIDRAAGIQDRISAAYAEAYEALKKANIMLGSMLPVCRWSAACRCPPAASWALSCPRCA